MKNSFIETHDNFLSPYLENSIENMCIHQIPYNYSQNIANNNPNSYFPSIIHHLYYEEVPTNSKYLSFFNQIIYNFCSYRNINLLELYRQRIFLQTPQNLPLSEFKHTDLDKPHWVCLYYVNDTDGDTIFFDDDENEIKRVTPKKGRIVFFDGSIKHAGSYPTNHERIGININFKGEFYN